MIKDFMFYLICMKSTAEVKLDILNTSVVLQGGRGVVRRRGHESGGKLSARICDLASHGSFYV